MTAATIDLDLAAIRLPDLPGFQLHHRVPVCALGEDHVDGLVALGDHTRPRVLGAFCAYTRHTLGWPLLDHTPDRRPDRLLRHRWATVAHTCGQCAGQPACEACRDLWLRYADGWWLLDLDADPLTPAAFPVTIYDPTTPTEGDPT